MGHLAFTAASLSAGSAREGSHWAELVVLYLLFGMMNKKMTKNNQNLSN
jgi:hypothetical protein